VFHNPRTMDQTTPAAKTHRRGPPKPGVLSALLRATMTKASYVGGKDAAANGNRQLAF
jgi:hypothetical protein